mmetsp:Transcript_2155/g.3109  ORF Transcript_2155/g.3109 Transcript_2155/m.3109 type:complete len:827 (-) Transcript_2155:63-2543(-)
MEPFLGYQEHVRKKAKREIFTSDCPQSQLSGKFPPSSVHRVFSLPIPSQQERKIPSKAENCVNYKKEFHESNMQFACAMDKWRANARMHDHNLHAQNLREALDNVRTEDWVDMSTGGSYLHSAADDPLFHRHPELMRVILENKFASCFINHRDKELKSPLHKAVEHENSSISLIKLLISAKASLKSLGKHKTNPLMLSLKKNNISVFLELVLVADLEDLKHQDVWGRQPLSESLNVKLPFKRHSMQEWKKSDIHGTCVRQEAVKKFSNFTRLLPLLKPEHLGLENGSGKTLLFYAAAIATPQQMQHLLNMIPSAMLSNLEKPGETMLHMSSKFGNADLVKWILKKAPSLLNRRDSNGVTAYALAKFYSDCDHSTKNRPCPKHMYQHHRTVKTLIEHKASVEEILEIGTPRGWEEGIVNLHQQKDVEPEGNVKSGGKWLLYPQQGQRSTWWDIVKLGVTRGHLISAKISKAVMSSVIVVYTMDENDFDDIARVHKWLTDEGLRPDDRTIYYKSNKQTREDLYSHSARKSYLYTSDDVRKHSVSPEIRKIAENFLKLHKEHLQSQSMMKNLQRKMRICNEKVITRNLHPAMKGNLNSKFVRAVNLPIVCHPSSRNVEERPMDEFDAAKRSELRLKRLMSALSNPRLDKASFDRFGNDPGIRRFIKLACGVSIADIVIQTSRRPRKSIVRANHQEISNNGDNYSRNLPTDGDTLSEEIARCKERLKVLKGRMNCLRGKCTLSESKSSCGRCRNHCGRCLKCTKQSLRDAATRSTNGHLRIRCKGGVVSVKAQAVTAEVKMTLNAPLITRLSPGAKVVLIKLGLLTMPSA